MVLDGRNRYRACCEIGVEPMTRAWDGKGNPLDYVLSKNLHRRHLTESQRAMVADKLATMKQGARTDLTPIGATSQDEAAKRLNVGKRSVQRAHTVRTQGLQALQQAVEAGDISVGAAAEIATTPQEEQRKIMLGDKHSITKAAKAIRASKPKKRIRRPAGAAAAAVHYVPETE